MLCCPIQDFIHLIPAPNLSPHLSQQHGGKPVLRFPELSHLSLLQVKSQLTHCTPPPNWTPSPGGSRYPASPGASSPRDHHGHNEPEPVPRANGGNGYLNACFQPGSASLGCTRRRDPAPPATMRAPRSHSRDCGMGVRGGSPNTFWGESPLFVSTC